MLFSFCNIHLFCIVWCNLLYGTSRIGRCWWTKIPCYHLHTTKDEKYLGKTSKKGWCTTILGLLNHRSWISHYCMKSKVTVSYSDICSCAWLLQPIEFTAVFSFLVCKVYKEHSNFAILASCPSRSSSKIDHWTVSSVTAISPTPLKKKKRDTAVIIQASNSMSCTTFWLLLPVHFDELPAVIFELICRGPRCETKTSSKV